MKSTRTARRYAQALLELSSDAKVMERLTQDIQGLKEAVDQSPEFRNFLINPVIKEDQKKKIIKSMFEKKVSTEALQFLEVLCQKRRENILGEIVESFLDLRNEQLGLVNAEVVSVVDLRADQIEALKSKLKSLTGKTPQLSFRKDPSLIGGFLVRVEDTVIDGSVRRQLEKLREGFGNTHAH
ncbi:ATP synthase F1 subunit delta [bacterium]|nr:ATP synthase F1 subunit delta [bacterium]